MSNSNAYNFKHDIPMEVYQEGGDSEVVIHINSEEVWHKTFKKDIVHYEKVEFYYNYEHHANQKNEIEIFYYSSTESAVKWLKLKRLYVNYQRVDINQFDYYPEPTAWWDSLSDKELQEQKSKTYLHGGYFGWFGEITTDLFTVDHYGAIAHNDRDQVATSMGRHIPVVTKYTDDQKGHLIRKHDEKD